MYKLSLEHTERTSLVSHTNDEDIFGIQSFFVPGIVLLKNHRRFMIHSKKENQGTPIDIISFPY